jgi:hypothetical protein
LTNNKNIFIIKKGKMEDSNDKLNLVREILRSAIFQSKTLDEQQIVLDQIIATGEVSRKDVFQLIKESMHQQPTVNNNEQLTIEPRQITYLENLPYEVFLNIIISGKLEGRDLIRLCNSSSLINEKCNRSLTVEGSNMEGGAVTEIPQFMFFQLLRRMGVEPTTEKLNAGEDYRQQYLKASRHKAFFLLRKRLQTLINLTRQTRTSFLFEMPEDLFHLFYSRGAHDFGIFKWIFENPQIPLIEKQNYRGAFELICQSYSFRRFVLETFLGIQYRETFHEESKYRVEIPELAKTLDMSLDEFEDKVFSRYTPEVQRRWYCYGKNPEFEDLLNVDTIFADALRNCSKYLELSDDLIKQEFKDRWHEPISDMIKYLEDDLEVLISGTSYLAVSEGEEEVIEEEDRENETREDHLARQAKIESMKNDIQTLSEIETVSDEELNYILYLYKKILNGEIPIFTRFTYEDLSNY